MTELERYASIVGAGEVAEIRRLAEPLRGLRIQHINSTAVGGGVAEILARLVPLMREVGLEASWSVLEGNAAFFDVTKAFHNALHGQPTRISPGMLDAYRDVQARNRDLVDRSADVVVLHDPQPAGLVAFREGHPGRWIWRCHIDLSRADPIVWGFLRAYVDRCDAAIFHLPEYARDLAADQYVIPPAIDAFSDKNRDLDARVVTDLVSGLGIDPDKPVVLQVSRFDRLKDPVGVIDAYAIVRSWIDCQLVLAGGSAADDPEGAVVLAEVRERAARVPGVTLLDLPPDSHLAINALQRHAAVVIQKSVREGFGLVVTEALWKGKPVIGANVGGIRRQILHGENGFLANSAEGVAWYARALLASPGLSERMGRMARESVRTNYLMITYLKHWLLVLHGLHHPGEGIVAIEA